MLSGMKTASPAPSLLNQVSCWYPCWGELGGAKSKDFAGFCGHPSSVGRQSEGGMGMAEDEHDKLKLEYILYCSPDMAIALRGWEESWTRFKHIPAKRFPYRLQQVIAVSQVTLLWTRHGKRKKYLSFVHTEERKRLAKHRARKA